MARSTILKLTTIILLLLPLLLALNSRVSFAQDIEDDQEEEYVLDTPSMSMLRPRSRFLASVLKKGARCTSTKGKRNVCNGVKANKGTSLLYCCKKHCRNVLSDRNNCGTCGRKCKYSERCCGGTCKNVFKSESNCGKCNKKCSHGVKCEMGICGYN